MGIEWNHSTATADANGVALALAGFIPGEAPPVGGGFAESGAHSSSTNEDLTTASGSIHFIGSYAIYDPTPDRTALAIAFAAPADESIRVHGWVYVP
jgi:hypothetical protein